MLLTRLQWFLPSPLAPLHQWWAGASLGAQKGGNLLSLLLLLITEISCFLCSRLNSATWVMSLGFCVSGQSCLGRCPYTLAAWHTRSLSPHKDPSRRELALPLSRGWHQALQRLGLIQTQQRFGPKACWGVAWKLVPVAPGGLNPP